MTYAAHWPNLNPMSQEEIDDFLNKANMIKESKKPTSLEQRILIAQFMGYTIEKKSCEFFAHNVDKNGYHIYYPNRERCAAAMKEQEAWSEYIPDYDTDYNAIIPAVMKWAKEVYFKQPENFTPSFMPPVVGQVAQEPLLLPTALMALGIASKINITDCASMCEALAKVLEK